MLHVIKLRFLLILNSLSSLHSILSVQIKNVDKRILKVLIRVERVLSDSQFFFRKVSNRRDFGIVLLPFWHRVLSAYEEVLTVDESSFWTWLWVIRTKGQSTRKLDEMVNTITLRLWYKIWPFLEPQMCFVF